jgi:hypothetical protein
VAHGKDAPEKAFVLGRLDGSDERFVAVTAEPVLLADMLTTEQLGRRIAVDQRDGRNVFQPI